MHLGLFGCLTELSAKQAELMQKFVPQSCIGIFRYERTRSTPLDPKLINLVRFVLFGCIWTVWLPYETRCKTGRTGAKFRATTSRRTFRNERTRSTPWDPTLTFWCISKYFGAFGTVWLPYETRCKTGRPSAKVSATKSGRNLSQRMHPILPAGP